MRRLRVGILDLVGNRPNRTLLTRTMQPNFASIMPQVIPPCHDQIREDLRFLLRQMKRPLVGWYDPNFGIRFEETMAAIEAACAHTIDLRKYAFSWRSMGRRLAANQGLLTRLVYEALRHCSHWDAPPHYPPLPARGP